ncbi:hypothetical protein M9H77_14255 [Catharanthus roseus]|uniref:Uncharacterized protein n=1 Tax=Catharanthus roseus TaxID=4058 RepID=A0ACC0BMJ0_CATRO|nr:hypothetical protein M9H77_14255 [Catharanthus roseus]
MVSQALNKIPDSDEDLEEDPEKAPNEVHEESLKVKVPEEGATRIIPSILMPQEILLDDHVLSSMVRRKIYEQQTLRLAVVESGIEHLKLQSNYYQHCIALAEVRATYTENEIEKLQWALPYQERIAETNCYKYCAMSKRVEKVCGDIIDGFTKLVRPFKGGAR